MFAYTDDITAIVSVIRHIEVTGTAIRKYKLVISMNINLENCLYLQISTWICRCMASNSLAECYTDKPVIFLRVCFGLDFSRNK